MSTPQHDTNTLTQESVESALSPPRRFAVCLLNDDYTPMDFVIALLMRVFSMPQAQAYRVMMEVHVKGKGVAGVFTRELAETKAFVATDIARTEGHPFLCQVEPVDE